MRLTIEELMSTLGCEKWPHRWREFYPEVLARFAAEGNAYATPAHYEHLHREYRVLDRHKETYQAAAEEVGRRPALSLFLALLCRALQDREQIEADVAALSMPVAPEGENPLPYAMLPGLALCAAIPTLYADMKKRGIPDGVLYPTLRVPERSVDAYMERHGGAAGFADFGWWCHRYCNGMLYRIGRLEFELPVAFFPTYRVWESDGGELVTLACDMPLHRDGFALGSLHFEDETDAFLAKIVETDDAYIGHPFDGRGYVRRETVTLPRAHWRVRITGGDPVINIHIPPGPGFDHDSVEETIGAARAFFATYFPDYPYRAFICHSWMLDPQLIDLLGEGANLSKFCRRFAPLSFKSAGQGVFNFVFLRPDMHFSLSDLPENTRLERAIKAHYLSGKAIYEVYGYFL